MLIHFFLEKQIFLLPGSGGSWSGEGHGGAAQGTGVRGKEKPGAGKQAEPSYLQNWQEPLELEKGRGRTGMGAELVPEAQGATALHPGPWPLIG